jgi:diamine N-acetyltransferase
MTSIVKADSNDFELLACIGRQTFIESHGHSASACDIEAYVAEKYSYDFFKEELKNVNNIYYTLFLNKKPAGYSKIILNSSHANIPFHNVTKLERLYLLRDFYDLKLGVELFKHNIQLSKLNGQQGMWLFVWKDNTRAVNFYSRNGFKVIGSCNFKISEDHSNPNHQMLLKY